MCVIWIPRNEKRWQFVTSFSLRNINWSPIADRRCNACEFSVRSTFRHRWFCICVPNLTYWVISIWGLRSWKDQWNYVKLIAELEPSFPNIFCAHVTKNIVFFYYLNWNDNPNLLWFIVMGNWFSSSDNNFNNIYYELLILGILIFFMTSPVIIFISIGI